MIVSLQDAMLNEVQAIIKKEEMAASTPAAFKTEKMADELETIKAHYNVITNVVGLLIGGLESI